MAFILECSSKCVLNVSDFSQTPKGEVGKKKQKHNILPKTYVPL